MRCIYPVHGTERLFVDWKFKAESPGIGQIKDAVKGLFTSFTWPVCYMNVSLVYISLPLVPPQMLNPMSLQQQTKPFIQRANVVVDERDQQRKMPAQATAPAEYVRVVKWSSPVNAHELRQTRYVLDLMWWLLTLCTE